MAILASELSESLADRPDARTQADRIRAEVVASSYRHASVPVRSETLRQAIVSLLDNARLAASGAGDERVEVRVKSLENKVILTVEGCGVGIASELLPRLGQTFVTTRAPGEACALTSERGVTRATLALPRAAVTA